MISLKCPPEWEGAAPPDKSDTLTEAVLPYGNNYFNRRAFLSYGIVFIGAAISVFASMGRSVGTVTTMERPIKIALAISSTYVKYGTEGEGETVVNAARSINGVNFSPMGTAGAGLLALAKIISERTGRASKYTTVAQGGSPLNAWLAINSDMRRRLVRAINAQGGVDVLLTTGFFNDAYQGIIVDEKSHLSNIRRLFALIRHETGLSNLKIGVGISQLYTGTATVGSDSQFTMARSAEMRAARDANCFQAAQWFDLPQADFIHMSLASYPVHAARIAENVLAALGLAGAAYEAGPCIISATAIYDTKTRVKIAHSTGTDFAPTRAISGIVVSFDDGATFDPATAVTRVDSTTFDLTHRASGGSTPTVYAYIGKAPSTAAVLRDNSPRALPLNPTLSVGVKATSGSSSFDPSISRQVAEIG